MLEVREYSPAEAPILSVSLMKNTKSNPFKKAKLNLLYEDGRLISKAKYNDLQSLLNYILPEYHDFYKTLKYTDAEFEDYALASQSSDDEEIDDELFYVLNICIFLFEFINKIME